MALDWLPRYPDRVGTDTDLPATYGPFYAGAGLPGWRNWLPIMPDWIWRRRTLPLGGLTEDPFPRPTVGLPEFPVVTYPDRLDPRRDLREYRFWLAYQPTLPSLLKNWTTIYPDRIYPRRPLTVGSTHAFVTLTSGFALPAPMAWQGRYADRVDRPSVHASRQQASAYNSSRTLPITSTGWTPVYPDRLYAKSAILPGSLPTVVQNSVPIVNPPPTNSTWPALYPHWIPGKTSLGTTSQVTYTANLEPIPNAPAPDQSWQQAIPTPPLPRAQPTRGMITAPLVPTTILAHGWDAIYPNSIPSAYVPPMVSSSGWQASWISAVALFRWSGIYPVQVLGAARGPTGGPVWIVDGSVLIAGANCVEWTEETFDRPLMESEAFTRPSMFCQPGIGYILLEDGSFLLLEDGGLFELETQETGYLLNESGGYLLLEDGSRIIVGDRAGCLQEVVTRARMIEEDVC